MSELYREQCLFLELTRTRLCVAVPRSSAPSFRTRSIRMCSITSDLVMMRPGVSAEYDAARSYLTGLGANRITDVPFYTMELFTDCELNNRAIVTTEIWEDIHPNLVCIPLAEPHDMPYGLVFPKRPSAQLMRLYETARQACA